MKVKIFKGQIEYAPELEYSINKWMADQDGVINITAIKQSISSQGNRVVVSLFYEVDTEALNAKLEDLVREEAKRKLEKIRDGEDEETDIEDMKANLAHKLEMSTDYFGQSSDDVNYAADLLTGD